MTETKRLGWRAGLHRFTRIPEDPALIEPWLREEPRPMFYSRGGSPFSSETMAEIRQAELALGVVIATREIPQPHEGPDFEVSVLFRIDEQLVRYRCRCGWDSYHWASSSPEHHGWFHAVMRQKGAQLTMLYSRQHGTAIPFGMHEPFMRLSLTQLLALARTEPDGPTSWLYGAVDLLEALHKRDPRAYAARVGPVMRPLAGQMMKQWSRELARRVRLDEDPWSPLETLASVLTEERQLIWATR